MFLREATQQSSSQNYDSFNQMASSGQGAT